MYKRTVVFVNIILFLTVCLVVVNCHSKNKKIENGHVNDRDTLIDEHTNTIVAIDRVFYRKKGTLHNDPLEFKIPDGESYVVVVVKSKDFKKFSLFVIEDYSLFLENAKDVMSHSNEDYTICIDDLESTYMRKSLSFEKGVFIRKEVNKTPSAIFDLSAKDLKEIENAYQLLLNE
ncbi:hypothetical protein [Xanthomarina sp. F2636L]|uniref:hypothetical protein n=1 Tax=Xanthomarina sp. F2636L TaxID=2996018 RepID=UPI00225E3A57|nr:hypothetical protein [Xanthomarina sp. F2636L]MCX7551886.1 hypothetical protein [Xanthomarina sp. F2636L]